MLKPETPGGYCSFNYSPLVSSRSPSVALQDHLGEDDTLLQLERGYADAKPPERCRASIPVNKYHYLTGPLHLISLLFNAKPQPHFV